MSAMTVDCAAVDFDLSADQQALREAAAALLEGKAGHDALRARVGTGAVVGTLPGAGTASAAVAADAPHGYDGEAWEAMAEQGWLALELPEDEGGLGLGLVEVAVLCEELGRRLVAAPFLPSVVALGALGDADASAAAATKEWREALSQGSAVGCTVVVPPGRLSITEGPSDGEVRLQGETPPALYAPSADVAVLVCDDGTYAVDLRTVGRPDPLPAMDRTRELGTLRFETAPGVRLGGADAATRALDRAATLVSAEMLGAADHVLSMSVDYAKDRVQFGKPIGSFQAVKHMLADMYVSATLARSNCYYGAWALSTGAAELPEAAATARVSATQAFQHCAKNNIQTHGGMGFTWAFDCHLFYRRSNLLALNLGSLSQWEDKLIERLRARNAA